MKGRLLSASAMAFALLMAGTSAVAQANGNDVVMRRPLPTGSTTGAGAPTPTPGSTTPTPTPTPAPGGPVDPTNPPPPDDGYGDPEYGWKVDCTQMTVTCMHYDGYGLPYWEDPWQAVPASECPSSQSSGADYEAHQYGYYGMGDGVDATHGLSACTSKTDPADYTSVYVATSYCNYGDDWDGTTPATMQVTCARNYASNPYVSGQFSQVSQQNVPLDWCAEQPQTQAYQDLVQSRYGYGLVAPGQVNSTQGAVCSEYNTPHVIHGQTCDGSCTAVTYTTDFNGNYAVTSTTSADPSACQSDEGLTSSQKSFLGDAGFFPAGASGAAQCQAGPDLYGANGSCKNMISYDPGWPTSGNAYVNYGFDAHCYAVYGASDPATAVAQEVPVSDCAGQTPTDAQKALLAQLNPALQDYNTMDKSCSGGAGINIQYERQSGATPTYNDQSQLINGEAPGDNLTYEVLRYNYVCTDVDNYFTGTYVGAQTYPMTQAPCNTAHQADSQYAMLAGYYQVDNENYNNVGAVSGSSANTVAGLIYGAVTQCDVIYGNNDPRCTWNNGNPPNIVKVIDHPDEQYYEVIVKIY